LFLQSFRFLGKERAKCDEFVKTYGPVLAELIAQTADPDTICRYLGACQVVLPKESSTKPSEPVVYPNHDYVRFPGDTDPPFTCTICQFIITNMKKSLALNQTEEEIIKSLKESCSLFNVLNLKQQCLNFLDKYAAYLIQMVSSDVEPKVACQSLGICDKNSQISTSTRRQSTPPPAVSTSTRYGKCIFGMNYWCTSRQNAELCNVNTNNFDSKVYLFMIFRLLNCVNVKYGRKKIRILLFNSTKELVFVHKLFHSFFLSCEKNIFSFSFFFFVVL
jgi:hypothetical protein